MNFRHSLCLPGFLCIVLSFFAGTVVSPQSFAQTNMARECLTPAGSVSLDGVEGRLDHLAFDPATQRLFIAGLENHTIEVVDLDKRQRVHQIPLVLEPQGLAFIPGASCLLACSRGDGTCRSFDANTFEEGPWVDLGWNADNIRFDSRDNLVVVGSGSEPGAGLISMMDLASLLPANRGGAPAPPGSPADFRLDHPRQGKVKAAVELPAHPESFQVDPDGRRIFVNVPDEHQIIVIALTTHGPEISARWPVTVGQKNFPMALDAARNHLYIACRKPSLLATYDTESGRMLSQTPCVGDADDVFCDAETHRLYVIGGEGFVDVFQVPEKGDDLMRVQRLSTVPRARTGRFIPELKLLAVAIPHTTNSAAAVWLYRINP